MEVEITIKIRTDNEDFSKTEIISDIKWGFADLTGYEIDEISVETNS